MKFLAFALASTGALANLHAPELIERQLIEIPCSEQGLKECGNACIALSYTCCPRGEGGCPSNSYCVVGDNDKEGCCPKGETCDGDGGASTDFNTFTLTSTIVDETTWTASLPVVTETTLTKEEPDSSVPPVPLPTPIPSNDTTTVAPEPTSGEPEPAPTAGAGMNSLSGHLVGGVAAIGFAALIM